MNVRSNGVVYIVGLFIALVIGVVLFVVRENVRAPLVSVKSSDTEKTLADRVVPQSAPASPTASGPSVPVPSPLPPVAPKETIPTVYYTSSGFAPSVLEVERGKTVRFVNKTQLSMRLLSNRDGGLNPYPAFDQTKSVGHNGVYEFTFTTPGTWSFKNQYDTKSVGVIVVK